MDNPYSTLSLRRLFFFNERLYARGADAVVVHAAAIDSDSVGLIPGRAANPLVLIQHMDRNNPTLGPFWTKRWFGKTASKQADFMRLI